LQINAGTTFQLHQNNIPTSFPASHMKWHQSICFLAQATFQKWQNNIPMSALPRAARALPSLPRADDDVAVDCAAYSCMMRPSKHHSSHDYSINCCTIIIIVTSWNWCNSEIISGISGEAFFATHSSTASLGKESGAPFWCLIGTSVASVSRHETHYRFTASASKRE
jgi:hypothetical protein